MPAGESRKTLQGCAGESRCRNALKERGTCPVGESVLVREHL